MQFNLVNVLVFLVVGAGFIGVTLLIGRLVRPATPDEEKVSTYECGERPIAQAWFNFNPRFYIIALIFLIFDVEIAFTYPVATVFRRWVAQGAGLFAFLELFVFLAVVLIGLAYVWAKGDLQWLKQLRAVKVRTPIAAAQATRQVPPETAEQPPAAVAVKSSAEAPASEGNA